MSEQISSIEKQSTAFFELVRRHSDRPVMAATAMP